MSIMKGQPVAGAQGRCALCGLTKCTCWLDSPHALATAKRYCSEEVALLEKDLDRDMQTTKAVDTRNPKDIVGSNKLPLYLWPFVASAHGCLALLDGMLKYGRNNWRAKEISFVEYIGALLRHTLKLLEGEWIDKDSGISHIGHILATAAIIADADATGGLIDDRNYRGTVVREFVERELEPMVKTLRARHADKSPKHYTIGDNTGDGQAKRSRRAPARSDQE